MSIFFSLSLGSSTTPEQQAVPGVMYQFLHHVTELQPYVSSRENFKDPKNRTLISEHLKALEELSGNLYQHERLEDPVFQMTANRLSIHLREAVQSFEKGSLDYSRRTFQEALNGCSSCHSQIRGKAQISWTFDENKLKGSDFEKAEFWYTVRQYENALKLYENFVQNFHPEKTPIYELDTALNRIGSILVRSYLDLDRAQVTFLRLSANKNLPQKTRQKLRIWSNHASQLNSSRLTEKNIKSADQLEEIAKRFLDNKNLSKEVANGNTVEALFVSGLLYDFVHKNETVTPEILYYLAKCEDILGDDFLLSISSLYLRRCIVQFPKSPTAQKCFKDYKTKTELAFTGSGGEHLPADIQKDLEELKSRLQSDEKKSSAP